MVVDALDLCYTKAHVDTFVIISGDSDFSPLVSKLRENNKVVIGVGVKNSTSDLLIANCDEFIYYDDLIRVAERRKPKAKKTTSRKKKPAPTKTVEVLLVGSKVRQAVKDAGCHFGGDAMLGLNGWVHWLIGQATQRAHANGRKTVRAHDFMVGGQ